MNGEVSEERKTSTLAIIAIVASIFIPLGGIILGAIAWYEIKNNPQLKGKNLAIAAIVISVLQIVIIFAAITIFLEHKLGGIDLFENGSGLPIKMLVIGEPSVHMMSDLDTQRDLVYYQIKEPAGLEFAPQEQLAQYDIILLDQHLGASPYKKSVSRALGEAIENYVKTGGKLVVVMDSGIYRSGGIYGTGVASDVIGWEETFGDIMPVECDIGENNKPTCTMPIVLTGKVHRVDFDSKIMEGIEVAPADPAYGPLTIVTLDVKPTGNIVAVIKNIATTSYYPGIVEKRLLIGKVIYFNYDPAMTPGIWSNTLEYLR